MSKTVGVILALKDKCSPQLDKIAKKLGMTEKEAKRFQKSCNKLNKELTTGLKTACSTVAIGVGALAGAMVLTINKTSELGDRVDKLSQKIGLSRKGFQEWDYVCSQSGMSVESLQMGFKTLVKQVSNANTGNKTSIATFKALGVSIKDNNGQLKNQEQIFNESITALNNMKNGVDKARIANDLFGRSGAELAPIINGESQVIEDLKKRANDLGLVMSDDLVDACVEYGDLMDDIKKASMMLGAGIAKDLLPVIIDLQKELISNLPQIRATVVPIFNAIAGAVEFVINNMNLLIPVISGVVGTMVSMSVITKVIALIKTFTLAIDACSKAQGVLNAVMLANPIGIVAVAIGGLIALVTVLELKFKLATKTLNKFKEAWTHFSPYAKDKYSNTTPTTPPKYATGTSYARGGLSIVGEHGAELVDLPRGSKVTSASQTRDKLGRDVVVNVNIAGNVLGNNEFITQIKQALGLELQRALIM